jgi:uncharacterized protein YjbI with pentapeptide repeats
MKNTLSPSIVERDASTVSLAFAQSTSQKPETFAGIDLHGVNLRGTDLNGVDLRNANLIGADLKGINLSGADLRGAALSDADLRGATLTRAMLSGATLTRVDLRGADLSNTILSGANLWDANLSGATLDRANLWDANLSGANLSGADIKGAILSSANLRSANLSRVNFWGTNLSGANLNRANLTSVDLSSADLSSANLLEANLSQADLSTAVVEDTRLGGNQGLTAIMELDLKQRGALFVKPGDRKHFEASRLETKNFESKNSLSQPPTQDNKKPLELAPVDQFLLPQETVSDVASTPDGFVSSQLEIPESIDLELEMAANLTRAVPQKAPQQSVETELAASDPFGSTSVDNSFLSFSEFSNSEDSNQKPRQTYDEFDSFSELSGELNSSAVHKPAPDGYVSPIARTAAAIRNRKARIQSPKNKTYGSNRSSLRSDYLI